MENELTCGARHHHFLNCKCCQALAAIYFTQRAGSTITKKKSKASRENGKLSGRPKKVK